MNSVQLKDIVFF